MSFTASSAPNKYFSFELFSRSEAEGAGTGGEGDGREVL